MAYTAVYTGGNLASMGIDIAGGLLNAIVQQIGVIGVLIITIVVLALIVDFLTGIFGIFSFLRGKAR
jgi:hypothetical protein